MSGGREFQKVGAAKLKIRFPQEQRQEWGMESKTKSEEKRKTSEDLCRCYRIGHGDRWSKSIGCRRVGVRRGEEDGWQN